MSKEIMCVDMRYADNSKTTIQKGVLVSEVQIGDNLNIGVNPFNITGNEFKLMVGVMIQQAINSHFIEPKDQPLAAELIKKLMPQQATEDNL